MRFLTSSFRWVIVGAALTGAYYSAVFACASLSFRQDTAASMARAARLVPFNSVYLARLAFWQPDKKMALLHRAVEVNPFDADAWIELGLASEFERHDASAAERYYLRAAEVDHMFLPKWTLTNFYFRQQNQPEFFRWAKSTLEITPYSADPVFTQMWLMSQDSERIARAIPTRPSVLLAYASFLANAHQYEAVAPIIERLVIATRAANPTSYGRDDLIGPIEDRVLLAGKLDAGLSIWQSMSRCKWVNLPTPTAMHPVNNESFRNPFFGHGFDWAIIPSGGVTINPFTGDRGVQITLSSDQAEQCALLRQFVPLDPKRAYRLTWSAEADDIDAPSGLAWHVHSIPNLDDFAWISEDLLGGTKASTLRSGSSTLYLLSLEYKRPLGSIRAKGSIVLRKASLTEE